MNKIKTELDTGINYIIHLRQSLDNFEAFYKEFDTKGGEMLVCIVTKNGDKCALPLADSTSKDCAELVRKAITDIMEKVYRDTGNTLHDFMEGKS